MNNWGVLSDIAKQHAVWRITNNHKTVNVEAVNLADDAIANHSTFVPSVGDWVVIL